jgi:cyanophycinase
MSEPLLVKGASGESYKIGDLHMAPSLGPVRDMFIDQPYAEPERFGRLLRAVRTTHANLGWTRTRPSCLRTSTSRRSGTIGCVYVVNSAGVTHCNIAEAGPVQSLSM